MDKYSYTCISFLFLAWTSALNLIIDGETDAHLDMVEGKVIKQLLDEKWKTFAQVRTCSGEPIHI